MDTVPDNRTEALRCSTRYVDDFVEVVPCVWAKPCPVLSRPRPQPVDVAVKSGDVGMRELEARQAPKPRGRVVRLAEWPGRTWAQLTHNVPYRATGCVQRPLRPRRRQAGGTWPSSGWQARQGPVLTALLGRAEISAVVLTRPSGFHARCAHSGPAHRREVVTLGCSLRPVCGGEAGAFTPTNGGCD